MPDLPSLRYPIQILHVAYTRFPADTRVKRELMALQSLGARLAVIALRGPGEPPVERWHGITVIRVAGRKSRGGFLSYIREYGRFVTASRQLISTHRALQSVRIVHVHTLPDFLAWSAAPARRRGARVVFDMHEIFPEFAAAKFPGAVGMLASSIAKRIEASARRSASLTITVNRPIEMLLKARPARADEKLLVLHNTADPADFGSLPLEVGAPIGPINAIYHGTLTKLYGLDLAVAGVAKAQRRGIDIRFTMLGEGPEESRLRQLAERLCAPATVGLEAPIPQVALRTRIARCAVGIVPTRLDGMTKYSLSTKLLEYVHLGLPVLAARLPSYLAYFAEDALWYWNPGDPDDLARAIARFATAEPQERAERAARARKNIEPLSWTTERNGLVAAYTRLLAR